MSGRLTVIRSRKTLRLLIQMPRLLTIAPHLSCEELQAGFRQAKTPTVAHHYQIIWLLASGKTTAEVMAVTGYSRGWIYELVWGYNHLGPESLGDHRIKKKYPSSDVEVWSMDEHRLGLKPVLRREWVDEFSDATASINWRFQWLWLYGFVHPSTGETYWWILPFVNNQLFERVLKDFAQHFQVAAKKRVVLVMDGAGWHLSKQVKIPKGIHLYCLPSHSPELQPAERLWPLTNEPIANRYFSSLDELEDVLFERCQKLLNLKQLISGLTHFYWWPEPKASSI
jgi:transposase/predicted DNA-binding transcriptional regulator AlpA